MTVYKTEKGEQFLYVPMWGAPAKEGPKYPLSYGDAPNGSIMIVAFVFEPVNLNQPLGNILGFLERGNNLLQLFCHAHNYIGKTASVVGNLMHVENDDGARSVIDQVDDIVKRG